jgi:hypothetical protein
MDAGMSDAGGGDDDGSKKKKTTKELLDQIWLHWMSLLYMYIPQWLSWPCYVFRLDINNNQQSRHWCCLTSRMDTWFLGMRGSVHWKRRSKASSA